MRIPLLLVSVVLATAGCGTGVYNHTIEVTINDPSKRLGTGPIEVSIFDTNGYSEEWARKTMGKTGTGATYVGKVSSTDMKMFYDRSPGADVKAGLALPSLEGRGYFMLQVRPVEGTDQSTTLTYTSYLVATREEDLIQPLQARLRSTAASTGWTIHLTVDIPR